MAADRSGAAGFITTEKDERNLKDRGLLKRPLYVAMIDLVFSSESEFLAKLDRLLTDRQSAAA
jgi:hypothetical protein